MNKQETKTDSNNVKTIATDKTYKVIITARFCHSKKVRPVVYYKITWQIVTMVTISKVVLLTLSKDVFPTDDYLYQDGQYLDKDTLNSYLNPKYTKKK